MRHLMRCGLADPLDWRVRNLLRSRSRVNSAIYISPIYQDAHVRHGISVRPIRKARSADYLPKYDDYSSWANCQQFSLPLSRGGGVCTGVCVAGVCTDVCTGVGVVSGGVVSGGGGDSVVIGGGSGDGNVNGVQQQHIKRFQLPTVSISIASDSDKALNELLI